MYFDLKSVLEALGPTASLIFAAWIFLSFLQQRYSGAYERYRSLIQEYRQNRADNLRSSNIKSQILLYKQRCEQMRIATNIGVIAAIFLITTLIASAVHVVFRELAFLKYLSTASALIGLALVIAAAVYVIIENTLI